MTMGLPRRRAQHELNLYAPSLPTTSSSCDYAEECTTDDTLYGNDAIDNDGGTVETETARMRSWESLRHKSIKRSILECLRDDGQQDGLARWNEADLLVADQVSLAHASSIISAAFLRALRTIIASTGPGFRITPPGHVSSAAHIFILYLHLKSFLLSSNTTCINRQVIPAIAPRKWHRGAKHHPALPHLAADKCESFCSSFHLIPKLK
ncbi:hypothetical protein C8R45DRAFT_987480 [Mycena sanguinolenta]|nr:hypothetical protein C8R45DRAFT_987480 [Mycena sanguinolenta]